MSLTPYIVMAQVQSSTTVSFVAFILSVAWPASKTRSPCAITVPGFLDRPGGCLSRNTFRPVWLRCVPAMGPVPARDAPLDILGDQCQPTLVVAATRHGDKVIHGLHLFQTCTAISLLRWCRSVELDQVLEDQAAPAFAVRRHQ